MKFKITAMKVKVTNENKSMTYYSPAYNTKFGRMLYMVRNGLMTEEELRKKLSISPTTLKKLTKKYKNIERSV